MGEAYRKRGDVVASFSSAMEVKHAATPPRTLAGAAVPGVLRALFYGHQGSFPRQCCEVLQGQLEKGFPEGLWLKSCQIPPSSPCGTFTV